MTDRPLGWAGIARLGLVQTSLGAVVVLMTSTINRVMVVELSLPAIVPGLLVALHYGVQVLRPRWGHGSDAGGRRTPWIIGGMAALALGGFGAAIATALAETHVVAGIVLATFSFLLVGIGVGAAGTSLLVLLAARVIPERRAAAATVVWLMMIGGFAITAPLAGHFLDPFTPGRLVAVTGVVCLCAFVVATIAVLGVEGDRAAAPARPDGPRVPFAEALRQVWAEPQARRFAIFVFVSMLAYSGQELILEPFAGIVFGMTPGQSTKLAGVQHGGVLAGMLMVSLVTTLAPRRKTAALRFWTVGGCLGADPEQHPEPYARLGEGRLERLAADRQEPRRTPRVDERHGHHRHRQTDQDIDQACLEDVRACRPAEHEGVDDGEHGVATL